MTPLLVIGRREARTAERCRTSIGNAASVTLLVMPGPGNP